MLAMMRRPRAAALSVREMDYVFGRTTRRIMANMPVPVYMSR